MTAPATPPSRKVRWTLGTDEAPETWGPFLVLQDAQVMQKRMGGRLTIYEAVTTYTPVANEVPDA